MNINNFETFIEEKILARGKNYFVDGLVADIWMLHPGQYHAVVDGSCSYDVEIHLDTDGKIINHYCDCPYDWGEYCKHEVATLLALRDHLKYGIKLRQQGHKRGLRASLLSKSHDDLVDLLCVLADEHDLRDTIIYHLENFDDSYFDE